MIYVAFYTLLVAHLILLVAFWQSRRQASRAEWQVEQLKFLRARIENLEVDALITDNEAATDAEIYECRVKLEEIEASLTAHRHRDQP